jgi:hypothetical protein
MGVLTEKRFRVNILLSEEKLWTANGILESHVRTWKGSFVRSEPVVTAAGL